MVLDYVKFRDLNKKYNVNYSLFKKEFLDLGNTE
jgi:hypothetical protein